MNSIELDSGRPARMVVDRAACAGHGLCYGAAPEIVDCDDQGDPVVVMDPVPTSLYDQLHRIIDKCPERALSITESDQVEG